LSNWLRGLIILIRYSCILIDCIRWWSSWSCIWISRFTNRLRSAWCCAWILLFYCRRCNWLRRACRVCIIFIIPPFIRTSYSNFTFLQWSIWNSWNSCDCSCRWNRKSKILTIRSYCIYWAALAIWLALAVIHDCKIIRFRCKKCLRNTLREFIAQNGINLWFK
jgi:hypothetical protein